MSNDFNLFGDVPPVVPLTAPEPAVGDVFSLFGDNFTTVRSEVVTEPHSPPNKVLEAIGKVGLEKLEPISYYLTDRQKRNVELYSRQLTVNREQVTGQAIWNLWPSGFANGRVSAKITDPIKRAKAARAGERPMIGDIQGYLESTDYAEQMKVLGIEVNTQATGLTAEQMGLITHISNYTDGKNLKQKIKDAGISWSKFQAWRSQPVFSRYYEQLLGESIKDAIPFAKQQIASKMQSGDMNAIKLGMELSGEYDPRGQKQIDAMAMLQVVLEILEEEVKDQEVLKSIATKLTLRSQALRTVER